MKSVSEIVVNPKAGDGRAADAAREIEALLGARGHTKRSSACSRPSTRRNAGLAAPAIPNSRLRRTLSYVRIGLGAFRDLALPRIRVDVDGQRLANEATVVSVANVPTYRGVLELAPDATPVDGLLDVVVVPRMPKRRLLALLLGFVFRVPGRWDHVITTRGRRVTVKIGARGLREELRVLRHALPVLR